MISFIQMIYYKYKIFLIISLFLLFPTLTLPIVFVEIYNQKKYALFLLAIFMGLLSMYYYPWGDQYRYMNNIVNYNGQSFNDIFNPNTILFIRNFNLIQISLYFASQFNFSIELYRFFVVTITYLFVFWILNNRLIVLRENGYLPKQIFVLFLFVFLSIPYYYICQGYRTGIGTCILICGLYYIDKNCKLGYFFLFIAAFIHYFFLIYSILIILFYNWRIYFSGKIVICCGILFLAITPSLINLFYGIFPFLDLIVDLYIRGKYGAEQDVNIGDIRSLLLLTGFVIIIYSYFFLFKKRIGKLENVIYANYLLILLTLPFYALNERINVTSVLLLSIYFLLKAPRVLIRNYMVILPFLILSLIYPYWKHRDIYALTQISEIVYKPLPLILQHTVSEKEINKYIDFNGEYVK